MYKPKKRQISPQKSPRKRNVSHTEFFISFGVTVFCILHVKYAYNIHALSCCVCLIMINIKESKHLNQGTYERVPFYYKMK